MSKARPAGCLMHLLAQRTSPALAGGGSLRGKNRRLKQAKEEAQAEIEQYRLQREKEFKAKEAAALGSHGSCTTEVEKETQEKMSVIQQNFQKNREVVLSQLLSLVCDIKPEIHVNYRING
ncbi:V-type proton ATPase subunit G 1 [Athene cunicularia]|uniref:V-type proton ATPase subunit G 1 n=1 Tax=Athene cunicularia TaxID=194338 RepID=UPI000EF68E61|nr:V-type proton ATPase subunit G 1 [Athene cunicularia]